MHVANLTTFSAKDAKARFGELLDSALGRPVGITKHDRLTAYVVSKNDYESLVDRLSELEDQLWLLKAAAAREEGFASADDVDAILSRLEDIDKHETKTYEGREKDVGRS